MGGRGGAAVQVYLRPDGVPTPDSRVTKVEDAVQKAIKDPLSLQKLRLDSNLPHRPGYGTRGTPVTLWANYVEMVPDLKLILFRYDISVSPEATGKKRTQVVRLFLETPEMVPIKSDVVTDFKSTLVSRQKLQKDDLVVELQYRFEDEDDPQQGATKYRVRVQYTNTLRVSDLIDYLESTQLSQSYDEKLPIIQAFNIFLNHYSKSTGNLATIGASKSFSLNPNSEKFGLGAGLTAIRGFFSSVRVATCRILVNVNVSHGAFYDADRLDQLIQHYGRDNGPNKFKLNKFLKKLKVRSTHLSEKKNKAGQTIIRPKTIHSLATKDDGHGLQHPPRVKEFGAGPKDVEFWLDSQPQSSPAATAGGKSGGKKKGQKAGPVSGPAASGRYISVFDFFKTTHGIQIANPAIPVVNVGNKEKPTYLPAEICLVLPGQAYNGQISPNQTQQMIRFAVRRPWENANSIVGQGFQTVGLSPQGNILLGRFGISVPQKLITVQGRVLTEPKVVYKNSNAEVQSGSWNMLRVKFNAAGRRLSKWSFLVITTPNARDAFPDEPTLIGVMDELHRSLEATGVPADKPARGRKIIARDIDDLQIENSIKMAAANLDLLFIILPTANHPLYPRIKQLADVKHGIQTICSVGEKLAKDRGRDQYLKNLALKFNLKMGGTNQIVDSVRLSIINEDKTMVVGLDVTHPSPGSNANAPSVAGMVANIDKLLGQWPATIRLQSRARKEEVDNLSEMLKRHLDLWKTKGKHPLFPENILVYRDGISEGQYEKVINEELPQLRQACKEKYPPADQKKGLPRFTIIIVGKRHHTRFYPTATHTADKFSNPKPGTVVDRGVTEAHNWDFFLQPHAALQGTARPAHYYVLLDEIFQQRYKVIPQPFQNIADVLEDLTHGMSYAFGRATKAVSVCPPAKYADMVCERARHYLSSLFVDTPTQSMAASVTGSTAGGVSASDNDVLLHPRLRDTMFYI